MARKILIGLFVLSSLLAGCAAEPPTAAVTTQPGPQAAHPQAVTVAPPQPPQVFLDTTYVPASGMTITATTASAFQNALNTAAPGDEVVLMAGTTYTGNFTLPNKSGSGWIIVRTSAIGQLPASGTRVSPADAGLMPKIITPNSEPALLAANGAHHFRFVGIEFGMQAGVPINYGIVGFGSDETSLAQLPHHLILDRVYVHANPNDELRRAVRLNTGWAAVIDSYLSEAHQVGFDTQAIGAWSGTGPLKIVNNTLEAAGENVLFGGAEVNIPNAILSDIEFRCNLVRKPVAWRTRTPPWSVKNLFELKQAQRILIEHNIFEYNWAHAQNGFGILFTPRVETSSLWLVVNDVMFRNNLLRHSGSAFNISGRDDFDPRFPNQPAQTNRIEITNNLLYDIDGAAWGGGGIFLQLIGGVRDIKVTHNTVRQANTGNILSMDVLPKDENLIFRDNITPHNLYGVYGSGAGIGANGLNAFVNNYEFTNNVIPWAPPDANPGLYPAGNFFPVSLSAVGFVNLAVDDYRLAANSPYKGAASDGADIGANIDQINAACATTALPVKVFLPLIRR
ncbi:MAG: hypothetical protein L0Y58_07430 [Verrucomicrobia subdivision 3 bacterium]|nr:hypothetical protein [Limisphaerales bacterium]